MSIMSEAKPRFDERLWVRRFTTAPQEYDYGCTREGKSNFGIYTTGTGKKIEVREIFCLSTHVGDQEGRNSSGLFPTWTEDKLAEEEKYGYFSKN